MKRRLWIDGIAWWSPTLPDWPRARAALRDDHPSIDAGPTPTARPAPTLLAANERRRAPDSVLMALEVASRAAADARHQLATLPSVFASTHGDLPTTDALCRTLATDPLLLSPTRFHHSVHNAASGYWAIGSASPAASTALSAPEHSFAAGLMEAACQCHADAQPVMLVAYDTEATGALASVNHSRGLLAVALVLSPALGPHSLWTLDWTLDWAPHAAALAPPPSRSAAAQALAANASAAALPLMEALAAGCEAELFIPLAPSLALQLQLRPCSPAALSAPAA
jgi:hypothetical protein